MGKNKIAFSYLQKYYIRKKNKWNRIYYIIYVCIEKIRMPRTRKMKEVVYNREGK